MADPSEFCTVRNKRSRRTRQQEKHSVSFNKSVEENDCFDLQNFKKRLNNCVQEICLSQFFTSSYDNIISALSLLGRGKTVLGSEDGQDVTRDRRISAQQKSEGGCKTSSLQRNSRRDSSPPRASPEALDRSVLTDLESVSLSEDEQQNVHLLSYGIGNFTTCLIARYQLAYFLAIRNNLGIRCTECCVYDPVFSAQEKLLLGTYGCQVISENEEGKRECTGPTVAFLPHCGRALYNNLLWRNLATNGGCGLSMLVLIGNSFSNILERTPERVLKKTGCYIIKLSPYITEVQLSNTFTHKDVFNDMAIHYFPESHLRAALKAIGQNLEEPVYEGDDAEFISK